MRSKLLSQKNSRMYDTWLNIAALTGICIWNLYDVAMANISKILIAANGRDGSITTILEPTPQPGSHDCCLWCGRSFRPRATGGSAQKFCSTGHRQEFWIAARRWTMRAIDAGLLSVDCLKASHTSVHAA
jgi:hypothetical protein